MQRELILIYNKLYYAIFSGLLDKAVIFHGHEQLPAGAAWKFERAIIDLVGKLIKSLSTTAGDWRMRKPDYGRLIGKHRRLVPTNAENWSGDMEMAVLQVYQTDYEGYTFARFALLAQGEQIHIADFPAFPFTNWYEEAEAIRIRVQAHAFEGKIFVIASTGYME